MRGQFKLSLSSKPAPWLFLPLFPAFPNQAVGGDGEGGLLIMALAGEEASCPNFATFRECVKIHSHFPLVWRLHHHSHVLGYKKTG